MENETKLTKTEEKLVAKLRLSSDQAKINPEFQRILKRKLMNEFQPVHSVGLFAGHRFFVSTLATFILLVPVVIAFILLRPRQISENNNVNDFNAGISASVTSDSVEVNQLKVEFRNAVNQKDANLISTTLADQVQFTIQGTNCCGLLSKDEALNEISFQIKDKQEFDFSENEANKQIKSQNPELEFYSVGIAGEDVLAFTANEKWMVDGILVAKTSQLIRTGKERIYISFKTRLNAGDYEGIKQLLAQNVTLQNFPDECCGQVSSDEALQMLTTEINNKLPFDFDRGDISQIKGSHGFLQSYILGINEDGLVVGFTVNDSEQVDSIFISSLSELLKEEVKGVVIENQQQ